VHKKISQLTSTPLKFPSVSLFSTETLTNSLCSSRKYPYFSHRRDWNFLGGGGTGGPKKFKKCMKVNWNFQKGGKVLEKILSVGEVWIFSGTTHCLSKFARVILRKIFRNIFELLRKISNSLFLVENVLPSAGQTHRVTLYWFRSTGIKEISDLDLD